MRTLTRESMRRGLVLAVALAALGGCSSDPVRDIQTAVSDLYRKGERALSSDDTQYAGESALKSGLAQYENGQYAESARNLQTALSRGLSKPDQVNAHKHLAFMHCAGGREALCRNEFRSALRIDPGFELSAAEAGHPAWGPVFKSVKSAKAGG